MQKKTALLVVCGILLLMAAGCRQKPEQHAVILPDINTNKETETEKMEVEEAEAAISYAAQNEIDGLSLPEAETFGRELKDFIYWEYATMIEKDVHGLMSALTILEEDNCLEKELKLHLYYYEEDADYEFITSDNDEWNYHYYDVVVAFPEEQQASFFSFSYNTKGFSTEYDYGDDECFSKSVKHYMSSQKLEQKKWFQKQYTFFGETTLNLSRKEAENFEVTDRFEAGKKEQILSTVKNVIKKEYKKSKNTVVYVRDFLPGDYFLTGEVIDLHMVDKSSMPLYWIRSLIYYSDKKMDIFEHVSWYTHYSTGYSGASQPNYNPTVKQLKKWAKEEKEAVNIEKCILAYQIKDGEMIDLKAEE